MDNPALVDIVYAEIGHQTPRPMPVLRKRVDGSGLILSFDAGGVAIRRHSLNRLSMDVYELCDGARRIADIRDSMLAKYPNLPPQTVSGHVVRAIRMMQRKGILEGA